MGMTEYRNSYSWNRNNAGGLVLESDLLGTNRNLYEKQRMMVRAIFDISSAKGQVDKKMTSSDKQEIPAQNKVTL